MKSYPRSGLIAKAFPLLKIANVKFRFPKGKNYWENGKVSLPDTLKTYKLDFELTTESLTEAVKLLAQIPNHGDYKVCVKGSIQMPTTKDQRDVIAGFEKRKKNEARRRREAEARYAADRKKREADVQRQRRLRECVASAADALETLKELGYDVTVVKAKGKKA